MILIHIKLSKLVWIGQFSANSQRTSYKTPKWHTTTPTEPHTVKTTHLSINKKKWWQPCKFAWIRGQLGNRGHWSAGGKNTCSSHQKTYIKHRSSALLQPFFAINDCCLYIYCLFKKSYRQFWLTLTCENNCKGYTYVNIVTATQSRRKVWSSDGALVH